MRDTLTIGPVPSHEDCEQLGADYNPTRARQECQQFIAAIVRECGEEPDGATLVVTSNPHDFGTYYEVGVRYEEDNEAAVDYAFRVESEAPTEWSDEDRAALGLA